VIQAPRKELPNIRRTIDNARRWSAR
jgi:hypothetical protein